MLKVLFDILMVSSAMFLLMLILIALIFNMIPEVNENKTLKKIFITILTICAVVIALTSMTFSFMLFKEIWL